MPEFLSFLVNLSLALLRIAAVLVSVYWQWASGTKITPYPAVDGGLVSVALLDILALLILAIRGLGKGPRVIFQPRILYPLLALLLVGLAAFALAPVFDRLIDWAIGGK